MPYRCKACKRSFGKAAALRQHDRDVHRPRRFSRVTVIPPFEMTFGVWSKVGFEPFMRASARFGVLDLDALSLSPPTIEGQIVNEDPT